MIEEQIEQAKQFIEEANAVLITACGLESLEKVL